METLCNYSCTFVRLASESERYHLLLWQATVAGTIIGVEAFLNRDTRDSLSTAERSYLHDSFKYTGGGLVLTALAARGMFKVGLPFRIMAANPCTKLSLLQNNGR